MGLLIIDNGLVYGSRDSILAWHEGMESPVELANRKDKNLERTHVTSVAFFNGNLYDATTETSGKEYRAIVRNTLTGEKVGLPKKNYIMGLKSFNGQLIAGEFVEGMRDINGIHVYNVEDDSEIVRIEGPHTGLELRPSSLDLAVQEDMIYIASENIMQVTLPQKNNMSKRLTGYLSDFVDLASDGKYVYSVHYHNSTSNPDGTEVRLMPHNKRVAYWPHIENESGYGFVEMVTLFGNNLVFGSFNPSAHEHIFDREGERLYGDLYVVNINPEMQASENGLQATPQLLLKNAYKKSGQYAKGNPIVAVPIEDLEGLIEKANKN